MRLEDRWKSQLLHTCSVTSCFSYQFIVIQLGRFSAETSAAANTDICATSELEKLCFH